MAKNLRLGRFLTVIVGDRIRRSLVDMLNHVNRYPHLATDVALVELHCYRWRREDGWPLLVVPSVVARTEIVERSVIQVTVGQDGDHRVDVRQERAEERDRGRKRVSLTEEAYWELLREQAPDDCGDVRQLIETLREVDGVVISSAQSSLTVRFDIPHTDVQASVFFIRTDGTLYVWAETTLDSQLRRAGIDPDLAQRYTNRMRSVMKMPRSRVEFNRHVAEVDVQEFMDAVRSFIDEVRRAAADL